MCHNGKGAWRYNSCSKLILIVVFDFRQEKEGLLTEAVQSFKEALGLDINQQTAKEHLEKLQQQLKLKEQVGHLLPEACKICMFRIR